MPSKVDIDGVLLAWGERLFHEPIKIKKGNTKPIFATLKNRVGQAGTKVTPSNAIRQKLKVTANRVPEVVVKITGNGKHMKQIKAHINYISRNGKLALEDQDHQFIVGREAINNLRDEWRDGKYVIPNEEGTYRESFNIVLSMPAGTNRMTVTDAVREFAKEEFGGKHDYVFVQHDDQPQSHVHLLVKARDYNGKRMNPRKADLQKWREKFAMQLRSHGIEANATKRPSRGILKKPKKQKLYWTQKKGTDAKYFPNQRPLDPFVSLTTKTHQKVLHSYKEIATALATSIETDDLKLAKDIVTYVASMPILEKLNETRENVLQAQVPKEYDKE